MQPRAAFAVGETCTPSRPHAGGTSVQTVMTPGGSRSYRLLVPPSYSGSAPVPLVVNMHGRGSNASEQEFYSSFSSKSDQQGFVVAYPEGITTPISSSTHFNAWQFGSPEPDDVAFITALLDALESQLCIDLTRVYSPGMSNGAMMSVRLACSLSKRIAASAPVAGAYYPAMANNLNPSETCPDTTVVPVIAFHGTADATVPFDGGPGGTINYRLPQDNTTPAEDVLSDWAAHDGCAGSRQEAQIDTEVRLIQYGSCSNGAIVELYAVDGGGHTWPGAFDVTSLGYTTHQISATDLIWSFFSSYTLPDVDVDLVPDTSDNCPSVYNWDQADADADALGDVCETQLGYNTSPTDADTDDDGCADGREARTLTFTHKQGGERDPLSQWDFYDVPAPAGPATGADGKLILSASATRNRAISLQDVGVVVAFVGRLSSNPAYTQDNNNDGIADGEQLDRAPSTIPGELWHSGPPNGAISLSDVGVALAQVGDTCVPPP
jgi:polyhydroxybutyrate depolymerase